MILNNSLKILMVKTVKIIALVSCEDFSYALTGNTMPRKSKRPCSYPGCNQLTDGNEKLQDAKPITTSIRDSFDVDDMGLFIDGK